MGRTGAARESSGTDPAKIGVVRPLPGRRGGGEHGAMRDARLVQLTLELLPGSEPIQGRVAHGERTWTFTGWLAFARAIGEARCSIERAPPPEGRGPVSGPGRR